MAIVIRIAAYLLSGLAVWQFARGFGPAWPQWGHLALDQQHAMVLGVCAGISKYSGIDVSLLRFAWVLATFYRGLGLWLYILAFLIMPAS